MLFIDSYEWVPFVNNNTVDLTRLTVTQTGSDEHLFEIEDVEEDVEKEKKEYDEFLEQKKKYRQFQKYLNSNTPIEGIPSDLLLSLMDGDFGPPKYKYKDESHPPRLFLIVDDCMGSDLFKPRGGLVQFCIKHRHIATNSNTKIKLIFQKELMD